MSNLPAPINDDEVDEATNDADGSRSFLEPRLRAAALALWGYRRILVAALCLAVAIYTAVSLYLYLRQPSERIAGVPFRLLFDGARAGRYPNGMPFSPTDIVTTPVVDAVFETNQLSRYVSFEAFANSLVVLESGRESELLDFEYRSKLGDPRLTPVDRSRLEQEYRSKLASARLEYTLTAVNPTQGWKIPEVMMRKVLSDVLSTWATQAVELRGVLQYQKEAIASPAFTLSAETADDTDMSQQVDILRGRIRRLISNIADLQKLPGGNVVRTGKDSASLPEVRARLEEVIQYELEPLLAVIRDGGLETDPLATARYFEVRLARLKRDTDEALGRQQAFAAALRTYVNERPDAPPVIGQAPTPNQAGTPPIPQISDSFIDRLMSLGSREEDLLFRQSNVERMSTEALSAVELKKESDFYQGLIDAARAGRAVRGPSRATRQNVTASLDRAYRSAVLASQQARELYVTLSKHNLNPRGQMYSIVGPLSFRIQRSITARDVALYGALVVLATTLVVAAGCLAHFYGRKTVV